MKIVEFYRGERPNPAGVYFEEIMTWGYGQLEMDHDWVQWVFPSNEMSMMNCDAPLLTKDQAEIMSSDPQIQKQLHTALVKFLDFLGLELNDDGATPVISWIEYSETRPDPRWWLRRFNHTMLRVTRLLKCLRLTGNQHYALALYGALMEHRISFTENTLWHWRTAVHEPLW